jgi:hypothetical protein
VLVGWRSVRTLSEDLGGAVGTSSKWRGPAGRPWTAVTGNVSRRLDLVPAKKTADQIPRPRPDGTEVCLGRDLVADRGARFRAVPPDTVADLPFRPVELGPARRAARRLDNQRGLLGKTSGGDLEIGW